MSFSRAGVPGIYRIRFFISGVEDPALFLWEVATSVKGMALNVSADIQRAEAAQSKYGCIKEDGVLGCIQMVGGGKEGWRGREKSWKILRVDECGGGEECVYRCLCICGVSHCLCLCLCLCLR